MQQTICHTDFTIVRQLKTSPRHAFRFWSDAALKARWNDCHTDWTVLSEGFDFRVGGGEHKHWRMPDGEELAVTLHYLDILPDERLLYAYQMTHGGVRLSGSLVTVTFAAADGGTRMDYTEQAALLVGGSEARAPRLAGTGEGLDRLAALAAEGEAA
ncbi:SRPBCC domain-containing protein [Salipiger sp.]|uniref:SRPBCC domain-containing protein n=1 Tax=Salipiger sp. TaxID=2078585 RepID=UPI003A9692D4